MVFEKQNILILAKLRDNCNKESRPALLALQDSGDFHIDPMTVELIALQVPDNNYNITLLTYVMQYPTGISQETELREIALSAIRSLGTFKQEASTIHQEMFSANSLDSKIVGVVAEDLSNFSAPAHLKQLIEEETKMEEDALNMVGDLDMSDRKGKYDQGKLSKFVQFRRKMIDKMGADHTEGIIDNVYCRFLDGYLFNMPECELHMTNFLTWRKSNQLWTLKIEDFPEIIQKDFLKILGPDKEGRPILYFKIKNFTAEGTTPERLALFNGVLVTKALGE